MKNSLSDYLESLQWRYSTKVFDSSAKLPEEIFTQLLEAMRLSASSFGLQLWKFIVVKDPEVRKQLLAESYGQNQIVDASHLIVLCRPDKFEPQMLQAHIDHMAKVRNVPAASFDGFKQYAGGFINNNPDLDIWMNSQLYIVLGNLLSACAVAKIDACPMEGFSIEGYNRVLGLGALNLRSGIVIPVGFRSANDKYASTAKVRFPLAEIVLYK